MLSEIKKDQKNIEKRENVVAREAGVPASELFRQVLNQKKYWFVTYTESGLEIAPTKGWKIGKFEFVIGYDFVLFVFGKTAFRIKDEKKRSDMKADFKYSITKFTN